jgi:hypothetical protein
MTSVFGASSSPTHYFQFSDDPEPRLSVRIVRSKGPIQLEVELSQVATFAPQFVGGSDVFEGMDIIRPPPVYLVPPLL